MITDLRSGRVRLRTPRLGDLDALLAVIGQTDADQRTRLRRQLEQPLDLLTDGLWFLAVEVDGALVGDIQARAPRYGFPPGVCELGVTLNPQTRGQGIGRIAVQLFTDLLLADGWDRVQATTAVDNLAMRRVLEVAGFAFEGVASSYLPGPAPLGRPRVDAAVYARCRPALSDEA